MFWWNFERSLNSYRFFICKSNCLRFLTMRPSKMIMLSAHIHKYFLCNNNGIFYVLHLCVMLITLINEKTWEIIFPLCLTQLLLDWMIFDIIESTRDKYPIQSRETLFINGFYLLINLLCKTHLILVFNDVILKNFVFNRFMFIQCFTQREILLYKLGKHWSKQLRNIF